MHHRLLLISNLLQLGKWQTTERPPAAFGLPPAATDNQRALFSVGLPGVEPAIIHITLLFDEKDIATTGAFCRGITGIGALQTISHLTPQRASSGRGGTLFYIDKGIAANGCRIITMQLTLPTTRIPVAYKPRCLHQTRTSHDRNHLRSNMGPAPSSAF